MTTWADEMIQESLCHGSLTYGGIDLSTPAWTVTNLIVLWQPSDRRGENLMIPGLAGRIVLPKRRDETAETLEMVVTGTVNRLGVPYADPYEGLEANLDYLCDNVFDTAAATSGATASLTMPSGATRTGPMQVVDASFNTEVGIAALVTVDVILPYGKLT